MEEDAKNIMDEGRD